MVSLWGYSELQDAGRGVAEPLWDGRHGILILILSLYIFKSWCLGAGLT